MTRLDAILQDIVIEPVPEDLSGRHPTCPATGCWGHKNKPLPTGYRNIRYQGRHEGLHRLVYSCLRGPIPEGLQIDHLCRNPGCCNPDHLEPVTPRVNTLRGNTIQAANLLKTHCPKGHPFSGDNLYTRASGQRGCRACQRERMQKTYACNPEAMRERTRRYRRRVKVRQRLDALESDVCSQKEIFQRLQDRVAQLERFINAALGANQ